MTWNICSLLGIGVAFRQGLHIGVSHQSWKLPSPDPLVSSEISIRGHLDEIVLYNLFAPRNSSAPEIQFDRLGGILRFKSRAVYPINHHAWFHSTSIYMPARVTAAIPREENICLYRTMNHSSFVQGMLTMESTIYLGGKAQVPETKHLYICVLIKSWNIST